MRFAHVSVSGRACAVPGRRHRETAQSRADPPRGAGGWGLGSPGLPSLPTAAGSPLCFRLQAPSPGPVFPPATSAVHLDDRPLDALPFDAKLNYISFWFPPVFGRRDSFLAGLPWVFARYPLMRTLKSPSPLIPSGYRRVQVSFAKELSQHRNKTGCPLLPLASRTFLKVLAGAIRQEKEKQLPGRKGRSKTKLFTDDITPYL